MTIIKMFDEDRIQASINFPNKNPKKSRIADAAISTISSVKIISYFFIYLHNLLIMTETKNPTKLVNIFEL